VEPGKVGQKPGGGGRIPVRVILNGITNRGSIVRMGGWSIRAVTSAIRQERGAVDKLEGAI